MRDTSVTRRALAGAAGLTMVAALASCSDDTPDAAPVADRLAIALASGELDGVPLDVDGAEATAQLEEITAGMDGASRSVDVADVAEVDDGDGREVELEVTWEFDGDEGEEWSYPTVAALSLVEDGWQVEWTPGLVHPDLTDGARLEMSSRQAERGEILGADSEVIVSERPVYRVGVDKTRIDAASVPDAARELAAVVDVDADRLADRAEAAGPKAFVEAITLREADAVPVLASIDEIDGAIALEDTMALAPTREFARPILGTVGEATAEIIEESDGSVAAGDVVGLSGLQQHYDDVLRGAPGITVEIVPPENGAGDEGGEAESDGESAEGEDAGGGEQAEPVVVYEREPRAGSDVVTTLDIDTQMRAEEILTEVEPASAIAVVRPSTGAIVAAASGPGGEGYSTATLGQYAPGSTFKIVTSLALLRAGLTPDTTLSCTPTTTVNGKSFKNYSDYPSEAVGDIPLRSAVAHSCNTALIDQRDTVTQGELAEAAAALGIGAGHDIGAPAFLGDVPAEADGTEHAASMIGQGKVLASPLAMATMAASVAAGQTVTPDLVRDAGVDSGGDSGSGDDGTATPEGRETAAGASAEDDAAAAGAALTEDEAQTLQELMRGVVDEGSASFLGDVSGEPVGAKTGTAEYGSESPLRTHAWMVAAQGDLAVAVFVEDGESGSQTAGPLLEEFLTGD